MSVPLLTLLVENSEDDALLLVEALRRDGYAPEFERVETAATMRAALAATPWDIILCDYVMPGFDAPAALRIAQEFNPDLPVIVVSGTVGEDIAVATIKLGAVDYLMKDRLARLSQAVGHALEQQRLRRERKEAERALRESEQKFASVFHEAPVWIVISDTTDSIVLEVNDAALQASGYSREEVVGHTGAELGWIKAEDRAMIVQQLQEKGRVVDFEMTFRAKDGRELYGLVSCGPILVGGRQCALSVTVDITARRLAEKALRESEAKLHGILSAAPVGIARVANRIFLEVNDAMVQMLGYSREEIFGQETRLFYASEEDYQTAGKHYVQLSEQKKAAVETRFLAKDGRIIDVALTAVWLDDANPSAGVVVAAMDISERKRTEQALRDSEEKFAKAFRAIPDSISVHEMASGRYVDVNPGVSLFFGRPREEILGKSPTELGFWADVAERDRFVKQLHREGSVRDFVARFNTREGGVRVGELSAELVTIGNRPHNVTALRDITARLQAEQALRDSEEKFAKAFRGSPYSLIISDLATGHYLDVNDEFERVSGYTRGEAIGRSSQELGVWTDAGERDELMRRLLESGAVRKMEVTYRAKDGRSVIALCNGDLIEVGGKSCLLGSFEDITERRKAEREKARLEEHLTQSQKLEALGTLSGGIAHDFNNILSAMIVYRELAVMDIDRPVELRQHLAEIGAASNRAKDLVRQILTFSRQQQQERRAVQLHPVVREALQLLRASLPSTLEIIQIIDEQAPLVLADSSQIHQIIMNLGTNAAHAMRDQPGQLKVTLSRRVVDEAQARFHTGLRPGAYVRLSIADTGHGIDEGTVARIFEPFFTTKGPGEGTGLGLSVVHGIMQNHDGAITVNSRPGEGTVFELYFPEYAGSMSASPEPDERSPRGSGESVLLIDDEKPLGEAMRNTLERLGYRVTAFTDPIDALKRFRATPQAYDLLVTDHTMPHMTGLAVIQEVHRIRKDLPVVLVSGLSGTWTREKLRGFNIGELVAKPLDFAGLAQAVRRGLDHSRKPAN